MDRDKKLKEIFDNDPLGVLNVKPQASPARNEDERLLASFQEINEFYEKNRREPEAGGNVQEHMLYSRLKSLRENESKTRILESQDKYGLLKASQKVISSLKDVINNDELGILSSDAEGIFDLNYVPKEMTVPDYIAQRKPCKDFKEFEDLFKRCQSELATGKRKLWPFAKGRQIKKGYFFVLKGVLLYVAEVGEEVRLKGGEVNARLRCVFENGTESDLLLRSLAAGLYKDGRRVTELEEKLLEEFDNVTDEDQDTGHIYILKSLSDKPEIKSIKDLYKIGFSRTPIQERLKNAFQDPTFLMAPVAVVAAYHCYNLNPQKLELLIHTFFNRVCLNVDIYDSKGQRCIPREWFIVPLDIIEQAIQFLLSGEIVNYRYDPDKQVIVGK